MKKIIIAALSLCMMFGTGVSMGACSKGEQRREGEIRVWWPGGESQRAAFNIAKEAYEATHEGITITPFWQSANNFYLAYMSALDTGLYPDIALLDSTYVQTVAYNFGNPAIANLEDEMGVVETEAFKSKIIPSLLPANYYEGYLYGIPYIANCYAMAYNIDLVKKVKGYMDKADYTNTDDATVSTWIPSTIEDMYQWCDWVTAYNKANGTSIVAYSVPSGASHNSEAFMGYISYVARLGGKVITENNQTFTMYNNNYQDDMNANVEACKIFQKLGEKNVPVSWQQDEFGRGATGNVLFIEQGCWKDLNYQTLEESGFNYGWAPLIALSNEENASRQSTIGMYTLVVTDKSTVKDIAIDFSKFLATHIESQAAYASGLGQLPVTQEAFDSIEMYQTETWKTFRACLDSGVFRPSIPTYSNMMDEVGNLVYNLLNQTSGYDSERGIKQVLQNLNNNLQTTLNEAYE